VVSFRCRLDGSCCKKYWIPVIHLDLWRLYYYGGIADLENYVTLVESKGVRGPLNRCSSMASTCT
jgi:hypothetical protein